MGTGIQSLGGQWSRIPLRMVRRLSKSEQDLIPSEVLRNGIFPCKGKLTNIFMYPVGSGASASVNVFFSSRDSYEWDLLLKVGEMGPEEASKFLVQTEMYVSKYTCKGRAPEFNY